MGMTLMVGVVRWGQVYNGVVPPRDKDDTDDGDDPDGGQMGSREAHPPAGDERWCRER